MRGCYSASVLQDYLDERVSDQDGQEIAHHVDRCQQCVTALAKLTDATRQFSRLVNCDSQRRGHGQRVSAGRYAIEYPIDVGGFATVYLAFDATLDRHVAIKIPRLDRYGRNSELGLDQQVSEGRMLAKLRHPHIVAVLDAGIVNETGCFIVSEYVEGINLAQKIKDSPPSTLESARLVIPITDALHYAHDKRIIHRDVKPANILLDGDDKPYLTDFGLALNEDGFGQRYRYAGTPAYMSPEQARGEGHLVDGRSDVFSLGVVLYELLVGQPPFKGDSDRETIELVKTKDPTPPREIDATIQTELARICLKAIEKRASDRYATARDMANDLRTFVSHETSDGTKRHGNGAVTCSSRSETARVVPKGLRSYDQNDADFFLELLPGPRDRDGLPECIRFWKNHIEETDGQKTFAVGLIYGPSGSGKPSLVRAGLLPRLAKHVLPICVTSTPDGTETQLLGKLRQKFDSLPPRLDLIESLAALRRGVGLVSGQKVLVIFDQFEQWLVANGSEDYPELVQALRHCDGQRVQCIAVVRDDFLMPMTSFMRQLEVPLEQGKNWDAVDLFQQSHAIKVLAEFGRAYGKLPDNLAEMTSGQRSFLDRAVSAMANENRKVVCVHLAIFAEMMKGQDWIRETWSRVGGAEGVGVAFLEQTFGQSANRVHQSAARAVLASLLPASTDIKGRMRAASELLEVSGYASRESEFHDLMRILDLETRLVTPIISEPDQEEHEPVESVSKPEVRYQLTHDYLVRPLRVWLTSKQRETRRGRAELTLAERASTWNVSQDSRSLPTSRECAMILSFTRPRQWTDSQRRMLRRALGHHGIRWASILAVLAALLFIAQQRRASERINALLTARWHDIPFRIQQLQRMRYPAHGILRRRFESSSDPNQKFRAALGIAHLEDFQTEFLIQSMEAIPENEAPHLIAAFQEDPSAIAALKEHYKSAASDDERMLCAIALLHLGEPAKTAELLRVRPDPILRTKFIDRFPTWHGDLRELARKLRENPVKDPSFRSGMCAALGRLSTESLLDDERQELVKLILQWYESAEHSGTFSAASWALRQFSEEPALISDPPAPNDAPGWYTTQNVTMIKIPAGEFTRTYEIAVQQYQEYKAENPDTHIRDENEGKQNVRLRSFYISDREISAAAFQRYAEREMATNKYKYWLRQNSIGGYPAQHVTWYEAVQFCNWLSRLEGYTECYRQVKPDTPADPSSDWTCDYSAVGYRLPSEAKWEYACRSGTATLYSFGNNVSFLGQYAVSLEHQLDVCGSRLPNAWGFFDMHGNVCEWCHDWYHWPGYEGGPTVIDPTGPKKQRKSFGGRVYRGGSFLNRVVDVRQDHRQNQQPNYKNGYLGFRVARTCPSAE